MNYKIGDRVRIKSLDWYNENKDQHGRVACGYHLFTEEMSKFCGCTMIVCNITILGVMTMGGSASYWTEDMFEGLVERHGKTYPYKIGDRVILKGNNRCATITDLKYNSWGNLSYYIKIDNDKDISIDYPTDLLLPYDNVAKDVVDAEPQDKMVSLNKVEKYLRENIILYVWATNLDKREEWFNNFRKIMEE